MQQVFSWHTQYFGHANVLTRVKRTNADKVRRAAAHPERPGAECKADAGSFVPVVNHAKCEGKGDCVEVCPYDVFDVTRIDDVDFQKLPLFSKLKVAVHGMKTAYTPHADRCLACGLCVVACPERAIRLERQE
jgi:NAD-dependent dihydropyrimidine dehydrogenase PreA subunit